VETIDAREGGDMEDRKPEPAFQDASEVNLHRIRITSLIAMALHVAYIAGFLLTATGDGADPLRWKNGIVTLHSISLPVMAVFFLLSSRLLRRPRVPPAPSHALGYAFLAVLLALGIAITTIDQYVTSNITPFLVVCLLIGAAFLHRPAVSLVVFPSGFLVYFVAIALVQDDPVVLLSNRVNGITGVAIGIGLSLAFWRSFVSSREQRIRIQDQQEELARMNRELAHLAFHDPLTGLPNRRYLDEVVRTESAAARRRGTPSCLAVLDIDLFKLVNDRFGHPVGDEVLRLLARLLLSSLRASDTVARLGGEEFIILLPDTDPAGARVLAEKLRERIAETSFETTKGPVRITASFGIAPLPATGDQDALQAYTSADLALYRAKTLGRDRVEIEVPSDD
jgi:diguanylate cyclase (GGDEF)-like protein